MKRPPLLRWLNGFFHSQYLPSLSINYVVINKDLKICYDQGCNEIVADIATKLRHCLFYLELYFSALGTVLSGLLVIPQECPLNTGLAS